MTKVFSALLTIFIIFACSFLIIGAVIYYNNTIKCKEVDGDWYYNRCWDKDYKQKIEL